MRFGKEVPALLVYDETGEHPINVYPKQVIERYTIVLRHFATINQFLRKALVVLSLDYKRKRKPKGVRNESSGDCV